MESKEIIIDGVEVSGCSHFVPRYMEDYDIDTLNYCGQHYKPCKKVDIKYCYYKQLQRKTAKCEKYEQALNDIKKYITDNFCNSCNPELGCAECTDKEILDIISKVKEQ